MFSAVFQYLLCTDCVGPKNVQVSGQTVRFGQPRSTGGGGLWEAAEMLREVMCWNYGTFQVAEVHSLLGFPISARESEHFDQTRWCRTGLSSVNYGWKSLLKIELP